MHLASVDARNSSRRPRARGACGRAHLARLPHLLRRCVDFAPRRRAAVAAVGGGARVRRGLRRPTAARLLRRATRRRGFFGATRETYISPSPLRPARARGGARTKRDGERVGLVCAARQRRALYGVPVGATISSRHHDVRGRVLLVGTHESYMYITADIANTTADM